MDNLTFRDIELDWRKFDEDKRTVPAILSTEQPVNVRRGFSTVSEVLLHNSESVDTTRARNGLPLLFNHNRDAPIGVVEGVRLENKRLVGVLRFSRNAKAAEVFIDVKDRLLRGVSIGYSVLKEKVEDGVTFATKWKIFEASITPVQADDGAQILRSNQMDNNKDGNNVSQLPSLNPALKTELERRGLIDQVFSTFRDTAGIAAIREQCKDDINVTVEQARQKLLVHLGQGTRPAGGDPNIDTGAFGFTRDLTDDTQDEFFRAATDATMIRAGITVKEPSPGTRDLQGMNLIEIARSCLSRVGVSTSRMSPNELAKRAFTTSDFPLILANVADKTIIQGYNEAVGTHRGWTKESFAKDFKPVHRVAAGETPDLVLVNENGEFTYGPLAETGTNASIQTYGRLIAITRQAIINDDAGAFLDLASNFGKSAMRLEADTTYGLLISNPTMQDSVALFNAAHNNIATAAVPTVTSLGEMRQLLRNQKGLGGDAFLDLQPFTVLAPTTLETVLEQLLSSLFDPFPATTGDTNARNPFANRLELIVDPRLDVDSTTRWYLVTNPNVFNWAERIFLEGQPGPTVEQQQGWTVDGTEFKARQDFAALITEFRGIVKNDGV